ncbi:MAG TPA: GNAT family N-acetyltransferase [Gemmataceae bacterium]|nr:GNAT family N-acetyltransferase [Gemmataceae bacterium]
MTEPELYYFHKPTGLRPVSHPVEFLSVPEFLADEPACDTFWELASSQFRTRSKFLALWPAVRFVALSRDEHGLADAFLLVNGTVNWQIDSVVVRPARRGNRLAAALLSTALNQAYLRGASFVMLTSLADLRPLCESCGFTLVGERHADDTALPR